MPLISRRNWLSLLALTPLARAASATPLIQPAGLAARLDHNPPAIFHVGFPALYHGAHIPGSLFAGPGTKPEAVLKAVATLPKDAEIVLYCGCCPWDHCPNVQPAAKTLAEHGYTTVRLLEIPTDFKTDWIDQGYPVRK